MKKFMACVWSVLLVLALAACGGGNAEVPVGTTALETTEAENVQMPNPWQECDTLEEAGKLAGFPFTAPETVEGFDEKYIAAIPGDVAEVIFSSKENENLEVMFRKGTGDEDISGDYNTYENMDTKEMDGKNVTIKGTEGLVYTATWVQDGFSYAISAREGVSVEQMEQWVQALA